VFSVVFHAARVWHGVNLQRENSAVQVCSLQRYQRHQSQIAAAAAAAAAEPTSRPVYIGIPNQLHGSCRTAALQ